ncbi:MAG: DUF4097 family beta strand repeat-containing protein [Bacteroidota bacterium]
MTAKILFQYLTRTLTILLVLVLVEMTTQFSSLYAYQAASSNLWAMAGEAQSEWTKEQQDDPFLVKSFSVSGSGLLRVFTPGGDIKVVGVEDTNAVEIRLYVRRGYALWSGSKSLENFRIVNMQRGDEITASVEPKNRDSKLWGGNDVSFSYVIRAPKDFSTEMQTLGGNIAVKNLTGRHLAKTNGGSLRLEHIRGEIKGFTAGGHIQLNACDGNVMAKTHGGNIQLNDVKGEVRTYSSGGNIKGKELEGTFFAQTNGGNIQAFMRYVDQGLRLESSAGNVEAHVPRNQGYEVVLKGMAVNFDRSFPFMGQRTNRLVSGQIGDGGPAINLSANVGTVSLQLSGQATRTRPQTTSESSSEFHLEFDWD